MESAHSEDQRNLEGDGQGDLAGHGGENRAVFVYQIESYRVDRTVNMKTRRKSPRRRKKLSISKLARLSLVDLHKVWTNIYIVRRTLTRYVE